MYYTSFPSTIFDRKRVNSYKGGDLMNLSEETKRKMVEFFMRTSVPRILADMKKQEQEQKEKEAS
jgi:hypothetical protein